MVDVDPLASMRCWAIEIELGGRTFEVPALPAVDWWPVLTSGDLGIVLDLIPSSTGELDDMILSGRLSNEELVTALTDAVEETAGRSFHASVVLASVANSQWASINGELSKSGFRWDQQSLGAALDAVYGVIVSRLEGDTLAAFLRLLDNDVPTDRKSRGRFREKAVSDFESIAGPRPKTGVVATGERSGSERPRTLPRLPRLPRADPSVSPKTPPGSRVGSGPRANFSDQADADEPASDTVPPPPPVGR